MLACASLESKVSTFVIVRGLHNHHDHRQHASSSSSSSSSSSASSSSASASASSASASSSSCLAGWQLLHRRKAVSQQVTGMHQRQKLLPAQSWMHCDAWLQYVSNLSVFTVLSRPMSCGLRGDSNIFSKRYGLRTLQIPGCDQRSFVFSSC